MITTLSLIMGVISVLAVIVYLIWKQGQTTADLRSENEAHREVDKIEAEAKKAWNDIDSDVPTDRAAARSFLSGYIKASKDRRAKKSMS